MTVAIRTETDTFGPIEVPADRYWGAQTERAAGNFKIGWEKQPLRADPSRWPSSSRPRPAPMSRLASSIRRLAKLIDAAAEEVIEGKLDDHFPLSSGRPAPALRPT